MATSRLTLLVLASLLSAPLAASLALPTSTPQLDRLAPDLAAIAVAGSAAPLDIIVQYTDAEAAVRLAPTDRPVLPLTSLPGAAYRASLTEVIALGMTRGVAYVELDALIPTLLPTATVASRAQAVWGTQELGPVTTPEGSLVDGRGVGVAVIDTGVDGSNANVASSLAMNVKVVGPQQLAHDWSNIFLDRDAPANLPEAFVPLDDSDVGGGHGTHVAGIVAANGTKYRGAAPGASIYAFGTGAGLSIVTSSAAAAFDWVITHHATVDPPIRVITNSYGNVGAASPASALWKLTDAAVAEGIVVIWAAGNGDTLNDGGTGADDRVISYGHNPKPGVLTVANYDDADSGTRDGILAPSSSRGLATNPASWPDISAPGSGILSAMARTDALGLALLAFNAEGGVFESEGNPFGNALDQLSADVEFRLAGTTSAKARWDSILWTRPAIVYNAHRDTFVLGTSGSNSSSVEATQTRYYGQTPTAIGPLVPASTASSTIAPGDVISFKKVSGTASVPWFVVIAPDGRAAETSIRFACDTGCTANVDLHALFPGAPADGTWSVSAGRTARAERAGAPLDAPSTTNSGTSMAAPHIAGVVALIFQANAALTPAQIEHILETTAYKYADGAAYTFDPTNPDSLGSFDKGHGLVDAKAAVAAALALR